MVGLGNKINLSYVFPDILKIVDVKNSIYVNHFRNKRTSGTRIRKSQSKSMSINKDFRT